MLEAYRDAYETWILKTKRAQMHVINKPKFCNWPNCNPADQIEGRCCGWIESEPKREGKPMTAFNGQGASGAVEVTIRRKFNVTLRYQGGLETRYENLGAEYYSEAGEYAQRLFKLGSGLDSEVIFIEEVR